MLDKGVRFHLANRIGSNEIAFSALGTFFCIGNYKCEIAICGPLEHYFAGIFLYGTTVKTADLLFRNRSAIYSFFDDIFDKPNCEEKICLLCLLNP